MILIVTIATIVSVFVLSFASDFLNPVRENIRPDKINFSTHTVAEYLLLLQYEKRVSQIFDALKECNESLKIPWDESIELFQNAPPGLLRVTNDPAKCLIDCVMRKTGVITAKGFQVDEYMIIFKQLRLNYTSYDINTKSKEEKQMVLDAINAFSDRAIIGLEGKPKNYELITTYEWAANECKDRKDANGNKCETSWLVARCIVNRGREKHFNAPFFPADLAYINESLRR